MIRIVADSREQLPYTFEKYEVEVNTGTLPVGDYSILGFEDRVAIERKSIDDLIACLMGKNRERFCRELSKLRFYELGAVVVESTMADIAHGRYTSQMRPHSALQSIAALMVRYKVPFMYCGDRSGGEYWTYSLLAKYAYEIEIRAKHLAKACNE